MPTTQSVSLTAICGLLPGCLPTEHETYSPNPPLSPFFESLNVSATETYMQRTRNNQRVSVYCRELYGCAGLYLHGALRDNLLANRSIPTAGFMVPFEGGKIDGWHMKHRRTAIWTAKRLRE
jgi:hypothetical protein